MLRPARISIQLVHIFGPLKGKFQTFDRFPVLIGRHPASQVRFDKGLTTISRKHARIDREGNRFRLVDTSTNGTYVNGKRIADVYLREGDVIMFTENGPKASFLTDHETARATPSPKPKAAASLSRPAPSLHRTGRLDSGMTIGPDQDYPVVRTSAPLVIQLGSALCAFDHLPVTIGADPACEFVIGDEGVAARHVQIFFSEKNYHVKDLTGGGMVTINNRAVGVQSVLAQGAELSLTPDGPRFRFLDGGRLAEIPDTRT